MYVKIVNVSDSWDMWFPNRVPSEIRFYDTLTQRLRAECVQERDEFQRLYDGHNKRVSPEFNSTDRDRKILGSKMVPFS